jgi:hypothetical protein
MRGPAVVPSGRMFTHAKAFHLITDDGLISAEVGRRR